MGSSILLVSETLSMKNVPVPRIELNFFKPNREVVAIYCLTVVCVLLKTDLPDLLVVGGLTG